ncbi:hypothetical protein HT031_004371 [Scenedesmus sp. PABB004]|nr:hypothetical protein HT031_004371 [Scenedesmus sp. PABB004]
MLKGAPSGSLPRLRASYPGAAPRPAARWPARAARGAALAACALLLLAGVVQLHSFLAARGGGGGGGSSDNAAAGGGGGGGGGKPPFEPLAAAVAALQSKAARAAEAAGAGAGAGATAQLGAGGMARSLHEQGAAGPPAGAAGAAGGARFVDVSADVRSSADALPRRPAVHGRVAKAGVTDPRAWLGAHSDARLDAFISWRVNRTAAGGPGPATADSYTCAAPDHPPLPFPGCHVFVNHKYKYIYVRSPKAASTSIVNVLGECNNRATAGHNASSCMVLHFYWNATELDLQSLSATWKEYFVFGFVRNPWRRAYSLYKYLHSNGCMHDDKLRDPACHVPWASFCADPWAAAEALHDRGCIKRSKSYLYFHMTDQAHCMRTAGGDWAVDFVGRVDEPNEDWAEVVRELNARRDPSVPELPVAPLEQKNVRAGAVSDPYAHPGAEVCFDAVSRWYGCDVDRFGFSALTDGPTLRAGAGGRLARRRPRARQQQRPRGVAVAVAAKQAGQQVIELQAQLATPESFAPFGQLIGPTDDGKPFDAADAQLELGAGTPRFYIMRLPRRGLRFTRITYHARVTQCLGGLSPPAPWYIVVARPSGSVAAAPRSADLAAFKVPHGAFLKFAAGTWHAGPLFDGADAMDFYNLELSDTNVTDHNTHDYASAPGGGAAYVVREC